MPARINKAASAYVWGFQGAADYLGVSRRTFLRIRQSNTTTAFEKRLLTPRIIGGQPSFRKAELDKFMSPALNAPGAKVTDTISSPHQHE